MFEWARHSPPCDCFAFSPVCVWEKGKGITRFPWMASAGRICRSLSSYLAEMYVFFFLTLPHVKFINIFSVIFFPFSLFFAPRSRFRARFSCQAGSHRGLNDHGRCTAHRKEQRRWCSVLFFFFYELYSEVFNLKSFFFKPANNYTRQLMCWYRPNTHWSLLAGKPA